MKDPLDLFDAHDIGKTKMNRWSFTYTKCEKIERILHAQLSSLL